MKGFQMNLRMQSAFPFISAATAQDNSYPCHLVAQDSASCTTCSLAQSELPPKRKRKRLIKTPGKPSGGKGKDLEKHQVKQTNSWKTIRRKGKRPGKPSGQTDKTPGKPSGGKGKDLENHQVKLINSWKTIRRKRKRPGKPSGQTDKLLENHQEEREKTWKTIRMKGKRPGKSSGQTDKTPGKPSGGKGKDLENHQVKLIRLLENHQEEREKTWKTIRSN
ncbi:choice-of-anchor A family protein [Sesbania bispinosa]|nr:choice-of-anchor A family protein [Sesbania bispinosa]